MLMRQPIKPLLGQICGDKYEILLRLNLDDRPSSPDAIIRSAEQGGWIPVLDRIIIEQALQRIAKDAAEYSINLSAITASDPDLPHWVVDTCTEYNISPSRITFELTETAIAPDLNRIRAFAEFWRCEGGQFALDDFGVGYTNLALLKFLPINAVKLDRSIVAGVSHCPIDFLTVDFLVNAARLTRATTIAEGVETRAVQVFLRELGVEFQQGWFVGMPELF
jgi:EAL domain-containing protein (putative c-di-GMP-specific phosphodiesterase class I)